MWLWSCRRWFLRNAGSMRQMHKMSHDHHVLHTYREVTLHMGVCIQGEASTKHKMSRDHRLLHTYREVTQHKGVYTGWGEHKTQDVTWSSRATYIQGGHSAYGCVYAQNKRCHVIMCYIHTGRSLFIWLCVYRWGEHKTKDVTWSCATYIQGGEHKTQDVTWSSRATYIQGGHSSYGCEYTGWGEHKTKDVTWSSRATYIQGGHSSYGCVYTGWGEHKTQDVTWSSRATYIQGGHSSYGCVYRVRRAQNTRCHVIITCYILTGRSLFIWLCVYGWGEHKTKDVTWSCATYREVTLHMGVCIQSEASTKHKMSRDHRVLHTYREVTQHKGCLYRVRRAQFRLILL
jgi:hypothetical protein